MLASEIATLWAPKRPEPSYPALPAVGADGQTSVPGLYVAGALAGASLIKLGLNAGVAVADAIAEDLERGHRSTGPRAQAKQPHDPLDLVVVGAGAAGLAAARQAQVLGLSTVVLEAGAWGQTVRNMFRGKVLFAEPAAVDNRSAFWFQECTREELLARWEEQLSDFDLDLREHTTVSNIRSVSGHFVLETSAGDLSARRVLLAMGRAGNPRTADVPGALTHSDKVLHHLSDPADHCDQDILVYGAGDAGVEVALRLSNTNRVTLVTLDTALLYPNGRNREALLAAAETGKLELHLGTELTAIEASHASFRTSDQRTHRVENDVVFEMIGAEPPLAFLDRVGIKLEHAWDGRRYLALAALFACVYSLYALKKFPEQPYCWPFHLFIDRSAFAGGTRILFDWAFMPFAPLFDNQALSQIRKTLWFQQGYLYSLTYTLVMALFGWLAFKRWRSRARDPRYQKWRYLSLIVFQVGFFLIANVVAVKGLSVQHAWRAWGLYQPWPLFFHTFHWFSHVDRQAVIYGFVGAGLLGTFVAIPVAAHRHGKRFCTWVCGCGGLAETLGDRFRHLSAKGTRSRAWEFQGFVVLSAATLATIVSVGAFGTRADNAWAATYSYLVDFWLVAVIPIALYPFFGGKVWCRYWCPLAAYNGLLARWYGKLEIRSNDKCISCTQCSRECQVGVDVMAFAKDQQSFDNRNSSCIQCGICIDVCPMDVLSFGQRDEHGSPPRRRLPLARTHHQGR